MLLKNIFITKYNYLVLILRILSVLLFGFILLMLIFRVIPRLYNENNFQFKIVIGLIAFLFILVFLIFHFIRVIITERYVLRFDNYSLILKDLFRNIETNINTADIKGYSTSIIPTRFWDFKETIVYLVNGDKLLFPQFLYWNYKTINISLNECGVKYLTFNFIFSNGHLYRAGQSMNALPSQILERWQKYAETLSRQESVKNRWRTRN